MSQRKQAAIAAALAAQEQTINATPPKKWWARLTRPNALAVIGLSALLGIGVLGATISAEGSGRNANGSQQSWLGSLFSSAPAATTTAAANPAPMPTPTPTPTPQLSKENIYAGGRLLASEDAGTATSLNQPADLVVWRLSTGIWYVRDSTNGTTVTDTFGASTDAAAPADFDGDGIADFSVYRPNTPSAGNATWYIQPNNGGTGFYTAQFGLNSDKPVPADYDGDGRADIAVWRASNFTYYILSSSTNVFQGVTIGQAGDVPVPADYDGDGRADTAVYRSSSSTWIINQSSNSQTTTQVFGATGDLPVGGDYDGDGKFDLAVRRNSSNQWLYKQAATGGATTPLTFTGGFSMLSTDTTVAGDYDGDGKTDIAVYRDGATGTDQSYWYIQKSKSNTLRTDAWGQHLDTPIAAPMKR